MHQRTSVTSNQIGRPFQTGASSADGNFKPLWWVVLLDFALFRRSPHYLCINCVWSHVTQNSLIVEQEYRAILFMVLFWLKKAIISVINPASGHTLQRFGSSGTSPDRHQRRVPGQSVKPQHHQRPAAIRVQFGAFGFMKSVCRGF